jgi:hypothetical protein
MVEGLRLRDYRLGFYVSEIGLMRSGFRVEGQRFRVEGCGLMVEVEG